MPPNAINGNMGSMIRLLQDSGRVRIAASYDPSNGLDFCKYKGLQYLRRS
jgi:hypothetical protein